MKKLILIVLLFATIPLFSQLKGTALLPGQINHSGIKVKFIAESTTAITDSVYTGSSGTFSANISNGLYKVVISKKGYRVFHYNNASTLLLTNTSDLDTSVLATGVTFSVSNQVYGTWESADTYVLMSDVTIPVDSTLNIENGVKIIASGNFGMTVAGKLSAIGVEDDKILFTTSSSTPTPSSWKGITILNQAHTDHCIIEYCMSPILVESQGASFIRSSELRFFGAHGIEVKPGGYGAEVAGMNIHDYHGLGAHAMIGPGTSARCNQFHDGSFGARLEGSTIIENNLIYNMSQGYALAHFGGGSTNVTNNVLHSCVSGIEIGTDTSAYFTVGLQRNTIYNNHTGVAITGSNTAYLSMNVIVSNTVGIHQTDVVSQPSVSYNLVWDNKSGDYQNVNQMALGQKINKNINGDSVDAYFNLSQDPVFWFAPFTATNSPVVNAGPWTGSGSTYNSIGAFPNECPVMQLILGIVEKAKEEKKLGVFPNPFNNLLTLFVPVQREKVEIQVLDLTGKICHKESAVCEGSLELELGHLKPGIYILKLSTSNTSGYTRIIKQ